MSTRIPPAAASMKDHVPSNSGLRIAALQSIEELEGVTLEELRWIADAGTERTLRDGELVFTPGAPPHHLIFILTGEVTIKRRSSSPVTVFSGRTGRITGKTPFSRIRAWNADGRASGNVWLLELHESQFPELLTAIPSMTERIVRVLIDRNREYTRAEEQIGKLAALSRLAGNLAHELNNPASAARSAALALSRNSELARSDVQYQLGLQLSEKTVLDRYLEGLNAIRASVGAGTRSSDALLASETEETLRDWLEGIGFQDAWKLAPILAEAEVSITQLQRFMEAVPPQLQMHALHDLLATVSQDTALSS